MITSHLGVFMCWECQPVEHGPDLSPRALDFLRAAANVPPDRLCDVTLTPSAGRELAAAHQLLIATHLEKELRSARVLRELGAMLPDGGPITGGGHR